MEVTDLKELKKLMKGDERNKFEFVEDVEIGSVDKGMLFSYNGRHHHHNHSNVKHTY